MSARPPLLHRRLSGALPPLVGGNLEPVAADVHAAPAAGAFFAGVEEVNDTRFARMINPKTQRFMAEA
jgi:hypothetical protein